MILRKWQVFINFLVHFSWKVYTFISILHKMILYSYCLMVWWWLQIKNLLFANFSKKIIQGGIGSNVSYFVHIWNISNIACHKKTALSLFPNSNLIKSTEKCLTILIWKSYKVTTLETQNDNHNMYVLIMSRTHFKVNSLYSCRIVKELLEQNRRNTCSLSDCNGTWIHNHLVRKRIHNH